MSFQGGIMIEAGRRCHTGEGQFIFLSKQGSQIHRAIEEAIMHQSVQELLAQATALPQEFAPQPPSPKSKPQDRSKVKILPPISMNQERPRPALKCKYGQQIHKTIEEVLVHQSLQELLPPSKPLPQAMPAPPVSPKPKTKVNKYFPVNKNQERPCSPALQNYGQPKHSVMEGALTHQNVQELLASSNPPQQTPPLPPPLAKAKPRDMPNVKKHPPANLNQERPCPAPSRRNISLPDPPPSCVKSPVSSPDDVLYSIIFPQPKPRAKMNIPKVATPPSLPQHFGIHMNPDTDVIVEKEKEWKSSQEPSESSDDEASYTNWTAKTSAEQDPPNIEDLYSKVNFASKLKNRQTENNDGQEQPNADQQTPVITSSEIPVDFKQTLSSILFRELSKMPPPFPSRSHGGSCDQIDNIDEEMTD